MARRTESVPTEPLVTEYRSDLKRIIYAARAEYLTILEEAGYLDAIYEHAQKRRGEAKSIRVLRQFARGLKAIRGEEEFVREMILDDLRGTNSNLAADLQATVQSRDIEAYNLGGEQGLLRVGIAGAFDLRNHAVLREIDIRASWLAEHFGEEITDGIVDEITTGFYDKGQNPLKVARGIDTRFTEFGLSRSENIARTEVNIMTESATFKQYQRLKVRLKQWLAYIDRKTRPDHRDISDSDPIPMNEPFVMPHTGDKVMHPGDPSAPARQLCRCRCTLLAIIEEAQVNESYAWFGE